MIQDILGRSYDYKKEHKTILSQIEDSNSKILGPWELIFDEFENYNLYNYKTYEFTEDLENIKLSQTDLFKLANDIYKIDYIILQRDSKSEFWFKKNEFDANEYYSKMYENDRFVILERSKHR